METVTIKDIARKCKVGVSTVSCAINNHPDINPETKKKIMDTIAECNYIPNNSARNLKRNESKTIAVMIKGIANPFFHGIVKVLESSIEKKKYGFHLQHVEEEGDEVKAALELEKEKKLCGIIFLGGALGHSEETIRQLRTPFVMCTTSLNEEIPKELYSSVKINDVQEAYRMVSYLCSLGHKKIAMVAAREDDQAVGKMRLQGYRNALADYGIPFNRDLILYPVKGEDPYSMKNGYDTVRKFIECGGQATAFFVISDNAAFGACKALWDMGKKIPDDYSVAGFDGIDMAKYYCPSLTTIKQPFEEMGKEAIDILFDLIEESGENRHKIFEAELVEGQSVRALV